MSETLSLFGGLEGDTPDTAYCPACGGPSTSGRCSSCRARGFEAPTLALVPERDPGYDPTCARCTYTRSTACRSHRLDR